MAKKASFDAEQDQHLLVLGGRIRELRLARNYRILDLAKMTGLTSSMISQVERGGISPSIDTLKKLPMPWKYLLAISLKKKKIPILLRQTLRLRRQK